MILFKLEETPIAATEVAELLDSNDQFWLEPLLSSGLVLRKDTMLCLAPKGSQFKTSGLKVSAMRGLESKIEQQQTQTDTIVGSVTEYNHSKHKFKVQAFIAKHIKKEKKMEKSALLKLVLSHFTDKQNYSNFGSSTIDKNIEELVEKDLIAFEGSVLVYQ